MIVAGCRMSQRLECRRRFQRLQLDFYLVTEFTSTKTILRNSVTQRGCVAHLFDSEQALTCPMCRPLALMGRRVGIPRQCLRCVVHDAVETAVARACV